MKKLLKILAAIIGVLLIVMIIMGKSYHYEKSIVINAPVEKIYANVDNTKSINQWNPWMKLDPSIKVKYSGKPGQVGDQYCWEGNEESGSGCQEITALIPNQKQSTRMQFFKPFESVATSDVFLVSEGNSTKVTWTVDAELDYPMNLMKFFMDQQMEKSYQSGLKVLKAISERPN